MKDPRHGVRSHPRPPDEPQPIAAITVDDADGHNDRRGFLHAFICENGRIGFAARKYDGAIVTVHIQRQDAQQFLSQALDMAESDVEVHRSIQAPPR